MAFDEFKKNGAKHIRFVPEGIEIEHYKSGEKEDMVLFVSRNHYYKGVVPFLESARIVLEKNKNIRFCLHSPLDKNSPYLDEVLALIDQLKREYPSHFFYQDQWLSDDKIREVYSRAKILVFPSNNEGFGIPLVEAMASGCVCITSDRAPMNEIVKNNKTGFCLPLKKQYHEFLFPDPQEIADTISRVITDKKMFDTFSVSATKEAKQYDVKQVAAHFIREAKALVQKDG